MSHSPTQSGSPSKGIRKGDQKVQFAEIQGLDLKGQKSSSRSVYSRNRACTSNARLHSAASLNSLSSTGSRPAFNLGSSSLERLASRSENYNRSSSINRKRPGSFDRNKSIEHLGSSFELKKGNSLDRRRISKGLPASNRNKQPNCDINEAFNQEKRVRTRPCIDRSCSGDRNKVPSQPKPAPPILTQNGINKQMDSESKVHSSNYNSPSGMFEEQVQSKSAPSLSPKKTRSGHHASDKENEKERERHNRFQYQENQEKTRQARRNGKLPPSGKNVKPEYFWKFERDVMWSYNSNSGKRTGYILFNCSNIDRPLSEPLAARYEMSFRFSQNDYKLIRVLMESHGFREVNNSQFNLYWSNAHFNPNEIKQLYEWQKVNHFPRSSELTRKDRLYMNIKRMQRQYGIKLFDFMPTSFVLPTEHRDFCDTHLRERGTWIVKPVASSQGKGIYLVSQVDQVPADETALVSRYLDAPLLVDGYKCDLRLYVLVTSLDPLVVYLYEEGLVRLATVKYQHGKNLWNPCIHLTNYSVNKFHSNYIQNEDPEVDDKGNKWSLSAFLRHLKARGIDTGTLMRAIEDVILKSLLSASYQMITATNMFVPHSRNCFELYGFDILIDRHLKPWVLEVNLSPSLNIDQPLDLKIKSSMLSDLFSLIGFAVCNPNTAKASKPSVYRKLPNLRYSTESYERTQFGIRHRGSPGNGAFAPGPEEARIFRQVREEYERRGGWARIFPNPDSWAMYGSLQEYDSPLNLILHHHLYPNIPRNGRAYRITPLRMSSVSSSGLASSLERLTCYERALPKTISFLKDKLGWGINRKDDKNMLDSSQVKASLVEALESGFAFSKYQARMAFSVYLQHIQRRLMIGCDHDKQTELIYRFLRSATRTLHLPMTVQAPSKTLPKEARAVIISKQLGDFIQAYTKETHLYLDQNASASCSSLSSQCPTSSVPTPSEPHPPHRPALSSGTPIGSTSSLSSSGRDQEEPPSAHAQSADRGSEGSGTCKFPVDSSSACLHTSAISVRPPSSVNSCSLTPSLSSISLLSVAGLSDGSSSPVCYAPDSSSSSSVSSVSRQPSIASIQGSLSSVSSGAGVSFSSSSSSLPKIHSTVATVPTSTSAIAAAAATAAAPSIDSGLEKPSTADDLPKKESRLSYLLSRIKRMNSDADSGICSADDEAHPSQTQKGGDSVDPLAKGNFPQRRTSTQEDGIAMELYRAFLSSARESDLEEILALQTKKHNSAGVFFDSTRRTSRSHHLHHLNSPSSATSASSFGSSCGSATRTPTSSPHGSPRRMRKPAGSGSHAPSGDPVTSEPRQSIDVILVNSKESAGNSSSPSSQGVPAPPPQSSTPPTVPPTSTCCLFSNLLKNSLKGTNTFMS